MEYKAICEQVEMSGDEERSVCATGMSQLNPLQKSTSSSSSE